MLLFLLNITDHISLACMSSTWTTISSTVIKILLYSRSSRMKQNREGERDFVVTTESISGIMQRRL